MKWHKLRPVCRDSSWHEYQSAIVWWHSRFVARVPLDPVTWFRATPRRPSRIKSIKGTRRFVVIFAPGVLVNRVTDCESLSVDYYRVVSCQFRTPRSFGEEKKKWQRRDASTSMIKCAIWSYANWRGWARGDVGKKFSDWIYRRVTPDRAEWIRFTNCESRIWRILSSCFSNLAEEFANSLFLEEEILSIRK